jgi:hypothetical protein
MPPTEINVVALPTKVTVISTTNSHPTATHVRCPYPRGAGSSIERTNGRFDDPGSTGPMPANDEGRTRHTQPWLPRAPPGQVARYDGMNMSAAPRSDIAVRMADLARATAGPRTSNETLAEVTAAAVELIPGVDTAGILLIAGTISSPSPGPRTYPIASTSCR